jgi:DNA-binding NarL/FixJ family response regulator
VSAFTKAEDKQLDVLIAHGLPLMCDSMVRALASPPYSFCASGVAGNATSLLQAVHNQPPDVAVIDSMLQDGTAGALSALREIARGFPKVRTVLVVDDSEQNLIVEAFRAGVAGVLHTQDSIQSAAECIRTVASGEMWAGKIELRALRDAISVTPGAVHMVNAQGAQMLSPRQKELVELVASGMTNKEIAEQMKLSEHTVKNYLFRIFDKLGVSSRAELIIYTLNRRSM